MTNETQCTKSLITINSEIKDVILASPFIALASVSETGQPHLIVVGKVKEIRDDSHLVFGVYKMDVTRQNLSQTGDLQVVAVSGKVGYRFTGKAVVQDSELVFSIHQVDTLL
ncbi:MAG TPA: pyridoxamine 5'-phosphate oxidase family protein [Methylomusa anaerophila]|uniref:Pyridoxamine 5'-phosphate oxidase N-terminal domain-containing protein n=1 Tax=Methylomusa anaerophila TaxID=1930071 RepID=A0A348AND6_9FIRM|nr:pyridoxamine 5'-phosphate oxidase family protein [Methylomusa anaerophila]BBB92584.1 hypothetical protein MAMMFC1_03279 [Methylomusa anaerophila]HML87561.1 pyridoxamine 5'-phosphate oxidase family protein [Methylomusa anaerophila]